MNTTQYQSPPPAAADPSLEVLAPSAVEAVTRAEVDIAIATARKYPRQIAVVKQNMLSFATLDVETAESCFYTLPRGGKTIQGPSVRLAEIAVSCYGNLQVGTRILSVVAHGESPHVVVQSVARDLEKNISVGIEKRRRITKKRSKDSIDEDDINLACNACAAICFRDSVFKVVPLALVKPVFEQARKVAIGDQRTLGDRRQRCLATFAQMGVPKEKVLAKLEVKTLEEVTLEHLEILIGLHNAIKEGEVNIDEAFAAPAAETSKAPAPTGFQQSQQTVAPAPTASATAPSNVTPLPAAAAAPAAAAPARRGPGRPPKAKEPIANGPTGEKFTPAEAAEMRKQGITVAPEAVQGEAPAVAPAAIGQAQEAAGEEAALGELGLAPQPPAAAAPATTPAAPVEPAEPEPLVKLRQLMAADGVSEEQMMRFCSVNKIAVTEKTLADFVKTNRTMKFTQLAGAWRLILPKVRS